MRCKYRCIDIYIKLSQPYLSFSLHTRVTAAKERNSTTPSASLPKAEHLALSKPSIQTFFHPYCRIPDKKVSFNAVIIPYNKLETRSKIY